MLRALCVGLLLLLVGPCWADKPARFERAMDHYLAGRYQAAMYELQAGYEEDPDPDFVFNMGKVHQKVGRAQEALWAYQRYLYLAPVGQYAAKARERVQKMHQAAAVPGADPGARAAAHRRALSRYRRAEERYLQGRYDEALAELGAGYDAEPDPDFLFNMGKAHHKAGQPEQALRAFQTYLQLAPQGQFAAKAQLQVAQLLTPAAVASMPRAQGPARRAGRPPWRLWVGGAATFAGAALAGAGGWALGTNGTCDSPLLSPQSGCAEVRDSLALGAGLLSGGLFLVVGGVVLMAVPGPRLGPPAP